MGGGRHSPEMVEEKGLSKIRSGIMCCVIALSHTLTAQNNSVNQTECHVTPPRQVCSTYADVHPDLICLHVFGKEVFNTWRESFSVSIPIYLDGSCNALQKIYCKKMYDCVSNVLLY